MHGHVHRDVDAHGGKEGGTAVVLIVRVATTAVYHHLETKWLKFCTPEHISQCYFGIKSEKKWNYVKQLNLNH